MRCPDTYALDKPLFSGPETRETPFMKRSLCLCFPLLLPFLTFAQSKARSATVTFKDGTSREYVVADRDAMLNPHQFTLTDGGTGKKITISPLEVNTVSIAGGDSWTAAILHVDQTPVDVTDEQAAQHLPGYQPRMDTVFLLNEFTGSVLSLYSLQDRQRSHLFLTKQGGAFEELVYRHYVQDDNGRQLEREDKQYQAQLAEAVKECPLVADATDKLRFSAAVISDLLRTYEKDCLKSTTVVARADRQKGRLAIAPMIGYTLNNPKFVSDHSNDLIPPGPVKVAGTPSFGLSFVYHLPVMHDKLAVVADLYYNSFKAKADTVRLKGGSNTFYTTKGLEYQVSTIRMDLAVQYYLTKPSLVRPYIKAGIAFGFSPSYSATPIEYEFYSDALHPVTKKDPFKEQGFKSMQFGVNLGAGVDISRFSIQYKFGSYTGYVNTQGTGSSLTVHSVFVSYRIK